jgi:hypothetical protein
MRIYNAMRQSFEQGHVHCSAYLPVLLSETDTGIASSAALDFCLFFNLKKDDPLAGAREVINFIAAGSVENRGALFGGLFALGDRRVHELLWESKEILAPNEVGDMARCASGYPNVSCVEFLVRWLEELPGSSDDPYFGQVASGLVNLLRRMQASSFLTGLRPLGAGAEAGKMRPTDSETRLELAEVAAKYANRLYALEAKEEAPRVMSYVIREFGLTPGFPVQEPKM